MAQHSSRSVIDKTEIFEMAFLFMGCCVTVGLLIVLPVLKILGVACNP